MMLRIAVLLAALAPISARLTAGSRLGQKLLSKSRRLNDEVYVGWAASYSIQFDKCHTLVQVASEEQAEESGIIYNHNLVTFNLCPSDTCGVTSSTKYCGQYVVNMIDFVDMYTEAKLEEEEWECENIRENCYCDNANDDEVCENQCYTNAGMDYCIEVEGEEFEIQRYLECAEMENQDGGDNNNNQNGNYNWDGENFYGQYFIGPYCSDKGDEILMGVFYDEGCSARATDEGIYESFNYGRALPFSSSSIVGKECRSCEQVDQDNNNNNNNNNNGNNNNNNNNGDVELIQMCEELYEMSARCESGLSDNGAYYQDTTGCEYINQILPKLEQNSKSVSSGSSGGNTAAVVFAWVFAITTLALGVYAFLLFRKLRRSKVNLSDQENSGELN